MSSTRGDKSGLVESVEGSSIRKIQNHNVRRSVNNDRVNKQGVKPVTVIINVSKDDDYNYNKKSGTNRKPGHNQSGQKLKPVERHKNTESNPEKLVSNSSELGSRVGSYIVDHNQEGTRIDYSDVNKNTPINTIQKSLTTVSIEQCDTELKHQEKPITITKSILIDIISSMDQKPIHNVSKDINSQAVLTESQSPSGVPKSTMREYDDDVIYFHFKDKDQDDIRFRVNNLGTYVVINGQNFNGELMGNDGRFIKFKYTNRSGNVWFWTIDQVTKGCKGVSPRLFTNVEMRSILLNDSILMTDKQNLMNSY